MTIHVLHLSKNKNFFNGFVHFTHKKGQRKECLSEEFRREETCQHHISKKETNHTCYLERHCQDNPTLVLQVNERVPTSWMTVMHVTWL